LFFPPYAAQPHRRERVSRLRSDAGAEHRAPRGLALTQERPAITLRGLSRRKKRRSNRQPLGGCQGSHRG